MDSEREQMLKAAHAANSILIGVLLLVLTAPFASATNADGTVVISEIHYNPAGEGTELEFIELHNPGTVDVDLSEAEFTAGVEASLAGVVVKAGAYVILTPEQNNAESAYGVSPVATYLGKLSNKGETITLTQNGDELDSVTYDNVGEWPLRADGYGPSLELLEHSDNAVPANWYSSAEEPTPGAANSTPPVSGAELDELVVNPPDPGAGETVTIEVRATGGAVPVLTYVVGFEQPISLEMTPSSAEGQFLQTIPGQTGGELIRYRVDLANAESIPEEIDSRNYLGLVVANTGVTTNGAPIFRLFVDESEYSNMMAKPTKRDISVAAVFAYDGIVLDNAVVEVRGGNFGRKRSDKHSLNVDLPDGYEVNIPEILSYPVDEFALNTDWGDRTMGKAETGWWIFEQAGFPTVNSSLVRLQLNSDFAGIYRFQEKLDGTWREAVGLDNGDFYKNRGGWRQPGGFEFKSGEENQAAITEIMAQLAEGASAQKTDFIYRTFDVPNVVNYMAVATLIGHYDGTLRNFYLYQNDLAPNLWSLQPWDLDQTLGKNFNLCNASKSTDLRCLDDPLFNSIYEIPELDAMVWARIATLGENVLASKDIEAMHEARVASIGTATEELETQTWGLETLTATTGAFYKSIDLVREKFAAEPRIPTLGDDSNVVISELLYKPEDDGPEILELLNRGTEPVDISGWTIDAVFKNEQSIPGGTIVLPGQSVVLTDSVAALRTTYPEMPNVVVIEYGGGLKSTGEQVELVDAGGLTIDSVNYSNAAPWPDTTEGGIRSLELVDYQADNALPESWVSSPGVNGSPGVRSVAAKESPTEPDQTPLPVDVSASGLPYIPLAVVALMVIVTVAAVTLKRLGRI
ncbi:MAG: lamin tail domain-containing protein [Acidimicrobiales bacterium]